MSDNVKLRIANGFNPQLNRTRTAPSYLEEAFAHWLSINYPSTEYVREAAFKRIDKNTSYFADFYFPSLSIIIELDGTQHRKTIDYDRDRDDYITRTYGVQILRISHAEFRSQEKVPVVRKLLGAAGRL